MSKAELDIFLRKRQDCVYFHSMASLYLQILTPPLLVLCSIVLQIFLYVWPSKGCKGFAIGRLSPRDVNSEFQMGEQACIYSRARRRGRSYKNILSNCMDY
jgi:hypothetical protein